MRLDINCTDRVGITQAILTVFSHNQWNIRAMDVVPNHLFVKLAVDLSEFEQIKSHVLDIEGVFNCNLVNWLPSEEKANHLDALLSNIPDAIIDVNRQGEILAVNRAACEKAGLAKEDLIGKLLFELLDVDESDFFVRDTRSDEVIFCGTPYFADISLVKSNKETSGAVIVLKSLSKVGSQLSLTQSNQSNIEQKIIGSTAQIKEVSVNCEKFAQLDLPVLICGETGTGKELAARRIHFLGQRQSSPFLAINCAALPEHLLESELFGYAPGAFSGAKRGGKPGLFELGNGGTVFLDEVGEMSPYLQSKLLRFLQDYKFRRVGGTKELAVNVRIISATHQNLLSMIANNTFREDLFYRLNVLNLNMPPLRERTADLPELVSYFCLQADTQLGRKNSKVAKSAMQALVKCQWPGNIRQLQNVLFRAIALAEKPEIGTEHLELDSNLMVEPQLGVVTWKTAQAQFEKELLTRFISEFPTTRALANRLEVSHNKIAMKLREHGFNKK